MLYIIIYSKLFKLDFITLHHSAVHYTIQQYNTLEYTTLRYAPLHNTTKRYATHGMLRYYSLGYAMKLLFSEPDHIKWEMVIWNNKVLPYKTFWLFHKSIVVSLRKCELTESNCGQRRTAVLTTLVKRLSHYFRCVGCVSLTRLWRWWRRSRRNVRELRYLMLIPYGDCLPVV